MIFWPHAQSLFISSSCLFLGDLLSSFSNNVFLGFLLMKFGKGLLSFNLNSL